MKLEKEKRHGVQLSIRISMQLMIMLLVFLPFLSFSLVTTNIYNNRLRDMAKDSLQAITNAQVREMTSFCEQQMKSLMALGESETFQKTLKGELDAQGRGFVEEMLSLFVERSEYLESSALIDSQGYVAACSKPEYELEANEGFEQLIQTTQEDGFYITNVLTVTDGAEQREGVIAIARITEEEQTLGYILAEISLDFYSNIRENSLQWDGATFYLLDGHGRIVSAGTADEDRQEFVTTKEERADYNEKYSAIDFEANPKGSFSYMIRGNHYITYYSDIGYTQWQIQLTVNLDEYLAGKSISLLLLASWLALFLLLSLWVSSFVTRRILKPVNQITAVLQEIREKQDYSLRIHMKREDELGRLSDEVDTMIQFIETENLDIQRRQRLLQEHAEQDPLTHTMNRWKIERYLRDALDRCQTNRQRLAVLFADIDDFKNYNTRYGHSGGDQVLMGFSAVLSRQIKGLVGRIGGDEFLVIVDDQEEIAALEDCLKNVERHLRNGIRIGQQETLVSVSCCIGAVLVDPSEEEGQLPGAEQDVIDRADALMYQVKNSGKCGFRVGYFSKRETQEQGTKTSSSSY